MAMIYQASAGAGDANKITISMWCRAHTTNAPSEFGDSFELIEFGDPSGVLNDTNLLSYVGMVTNTDGSGVDASLYNNIYLQLSGAKGSVDGAAYCFKTEPGSGPPIISTLYRPKVAPGAGAINFEHVTESVYTPQLAAGTGNLGSMVAPDKWFHVMIAADASNDTSYGGANNKLRVVVNGFTQNLYGPAGVGGDMWTGGQMQPRLIDANEAFNDNGLGPSYSVSSSRDVTFNIPAFDFCVNGFEIGIPSRRDSSVKNTQLLDVADVQIWVGKYIDPTTNFGKFVYVDEEGRGTPVSPDEAADAFGLQTYLFKGEREDFLINQGSGGDFSYSGTITSSSGVAY